MFTFYGTEKSRNVDPWLVALTLAPEEDTDLATYTLGDLSFIICEMGLIGVSTS